MCVCVCIYIYIYIYIYTVYMCIYTRYLAYVDTHVTAEEKGGRIVEPVTLAIGDGAMLYYIILMICHIV